MFYIAGCQPTAHSGRSNLGMVNVVYLRLDVLLQGSRGSRKPGESRNGDKGRESQDMGKMVGKFKKWGKRSGKSWNGEFNPVPGKGHGF